MNEEKVEKETEEKEKEKEEEEVEDDTPHTLGPRSGPRTSNFI
jgi:hypothetical protein